MIPVPGQLAIKTRRGRYGAFNVGYLSTSIGEFVTKNAELDQYKEGKYEGEFIITEIFLGTYTTGGRTITELRAKLSGMTISGVDKLTPVDSQRLTPQETDPIDEQNAAPQPVPQTPAPEISAHAVADAPTADPLTVDAPTVDVPTADAAAADAPAIDTAAVDPLVDTTPFGVSPGKARTAQKTAAKGAGAEDADRALFGLLWPLASVVKLDATVERRVYRQQISRLDELGYGFEALTQDWHRKAA
jgi:hypothetical protein